MEKSYQITLEYACAGIIVKGNIVRRTAPIFKWMVGKDIQTIQEWVNKKHGVIKEVKR